MNKDFLCPTCGAPFDPTRGIGELGRHSVVDGIPKDEIFALRLNCGGAKQSHSWDLPGKTMLDAVAERPEFAAGYIRTKLADSALGAILRGGSP